MRRGGGDNPPIHFLKANLNRLIELKQPNMIVLPREQIYDKLRGMIAKSIK